MDVILFRDGTMQDFTLDVDEENANNPLDAKEEDLGPIESFWKLIDRSVTVAQPTLGCPAPNFTQADIRANAVLEAFLNPEQIEDFRIYNRFISTGATTGHRYMLTSRRQQGELDKYSGRSLFDLDEDRAFCVHDWTIPAAEELLTLHLFLQRRESYLRAIPE